MSDPKGEKPESDHPHEDEFPLELHTDQAGAGSLGDEFPLESLSTSASIEDFQFSGPAEELDFTEPADFAFPTEQPSAVESSGEFAPPQEAEGQPSLGAEEGSFGESLPTEEAVAEPLLAEEGIPDLKAAEEGESEAPKPKFELPAWVHTLEWVTVGLLAVGGLLAVVCSVVWVKDARQVTLTLNIACPLLLALIPYALWRSSVRWVTPQITALYTVMLALSTAALIAGTWLEGLELSSYEWQFSKARVSAAKPRVVVIPLPEPTPAKDVEPPSIPAATPSAEPAAKPATDAAAKP